MIRKRRFNLHDTTDSGDTSAKKVIFLQYEMPPLKTGEYTINVRQDVNLNIGTPYSATRKFAVTGQRFTLDPLDFNAVFPPELANGEFMGTLPLVTFNRRTLPWERSSVESDSSAPWLALLLFNEGETPDIQKLTVKDLVPVTETIAMPNSDVITLGAMPVTAYSYPGLDNLEYGETPDDPVNVIEISAGLFNTVSPAAGDLPFLAHIRDVETIDKTDEKITDETAYAVVFGNRMPLVGTSSYAFLVSLENMGANLPGENGENNLPDDKTTVRLITYKSWHFTANDGGETLERLLENLNKNDDCKNGLSTLQYPFSGEPPSAETVSEALAHQAAGMMTKADAQVLVRNGFTMGYVGMPQQLRHPGNTISWYRGPLTPYAIPERVSTPISTPDSVNRYDPQTGMFDVSYGAAWQIGQLLALQNKAFSAALYNWKKGESRQQILAAEQEIIDGKYGSMTAFNHILSARRRALSAGEEAPIPDDIVLWMSQLSLLKGVPFNYLVPDERMLPAESLRLFYMDDNWIDCLLDGAFSIGSSTTGEETKDAMLKQRLRPAIKQRSRRLRQRKTSLLTYENTNSLTTGILLRSAAVGGWPGLEINGYSDSEGTNEIPKLRMERLSNDTLICIFDGAVQLLCIHEPPEVLHEGLEYEDGTWITTLRTLDGDDPGAQITGGYATVTLRGDGQTLNVEETAKSIVAALKANGEDVITFTSAEFALELIQGVVKVNYLLTDT